MQFYKTVPSVYIVSVVPFLLTLFIFVESQSIFFPRRFVFRQNPPITYKIQSDPRQVKRNHVTRDNLFGWLNLKNYVRFHMWSRDNPELAHEIKVNDMESLRTSSFNSKRLTKFIIHGYQDNANELAVGDWIIFMKNAYLSLGDVNVIAVDYSFYATTPFYLVPVHELASGKLTDMLQFLVNNGLDLNSVHLIGFSWGAHVSGLTGHALKGRIGRITGLDPAGPTFKFIDNEFRLDKSDAQFVDIIHTNGGTRLLWGGHFGIRDALGHVDIYPNGGERQTGCPVEHTLSPESLLCNHGRAGRYFIESVTSPLAFPMCQCNDFDKFVRNECTCSAEETAYLGEHISRRTRGIFQLITRSHYPYGHGPHLNVSLSSIDSNEDTTNFLELVLEGPERRPRSSVNSSDSATTATTTTAVKNPQNEDEKHFFDSQAQIDKFKIAEYELNLDVAKIQYKNLTMKFLFQNRFNAKDYPNEDILRMSLYALRKMNTTQSNNSEKYYLL